MVEIRVTLDASARNATALLDVAEQLHQRRQLRFGKWVVPVAIVNELDADGLTAVVKNVICTSSSGTLARNVPSRSIM